MKEKNKILKKIIKGLSNSDSNSDVKEVLKDSERYLLKTEKEMQEIARKLKENVEMKTLDMAKNRITELKDQVQKVFDSLNTLKEELKQNESQLVSKLNEKLDALKTAMAEYRSAGLKDFKGISSEMNNLKMDIREISQRKVEIPDYKNQISKIENELKRAISDLEGKNETQQKNTEKQTQGILTESKITVAKLDEDIKKLRRDAMSAIASKGGGNMNRNILVSNNPSTLGRYTDLNLKAGANITLTYTNNDNLKTTDLTIAASGSVSGGTSRNISTVTVSSVLADTASTDIVVIAGAGVKLTMPTAVSNTNLYTIKNKAASSVLIVADGAETIDGDPNIILATQYVSVDLISDNANWHIT